jgi:hypothetical protein
MCKWVVMMHAPEIKELDNMGREVSYGRRTAVQLMLVEAEQRR